MQPFNRKSKIIEVYSILLIDLLCVVLAYMLALLMRFKDFEVIVNNTPDLGLQLH